MDKTTLCDWEEKPKCEYLLLHGEHGTENLMILVQIFVVFVICQCDAIVVESTKLAILGWNLCSKCWNFVVGLLSKNCPRK